MTPRTAVGRFAVVVASLLLTFAGAAPGAGASGDAWDAFAFTASADVLRATVVEPGAPFQTDDTDIVDPGVFRARATLDAVGVSTASADVFAPGDALATALAIPVNLVRTNAPPVVVIPAIGMPMHATSDASSTPTASATTGATTVEATSSRDRSAGDAGAASVAVVHAEASQAADGTLHAAASVRVTGIALGPVTVGELRSVADVVQRPGFPAQATRDIAVTGLVVSGTEVTLRSGQSYNESPVHVSVLEGTDDGVWVTSPALAVRVEIPAALVSGASTSVAFIVGRARVRHTAVAAVAEAEEPEADTDANGAFETRSSAVASSVPAPGADGGVDVPQVAFTNAVVSPDARRDVFRIVRGPSHLTAAGKTALAALPVVLLVVSLAIYRRARPTRTL